MLFLSRRGAANRADAVFVHRFVAITVAVVFALIGGSIPLRGQAPARLHGEVLDPLGAVVVHAAVDLVKATKVVATTTSGVDGSFEFNVAAAGRYAVRATAATFETTTTPAVYLGTSGRADVTITMATRTVTQQVTVTATGTPTPEAQVGSAVTVLPAEEYRFMLEVQDPLRLVPGVQLTQTGQMGGTTGLSIRGGDTDANKVLIDGVPVNAVGGGVEFANIATTGLQSIEVLREPNSALYGSDALAGVVNMTTARGTTRLPLFTYAGDAGNFGTYRDEVSAGTAYGQFDLYSSFARIDSRNNFANSEFHNATYAGNFGWTPNAANDLRFTVRHLAVSGGQPNAIALYGIADDAQQKEQDDVFSGVWNNQATDKWHNQIRYGGLRLNGQFNSFGATGIYDQGTGYYDGAPVTITGANGYTVSGQALFQYSDQATSYLSPTTRNFIYAQTDYRVDAHMVALGAFKFEKEQGAFGYAGSTLTTIDRGNYSYTMQVSGDIRNRLFYNLGAGLEDNGLFGFAASPRASLAYYLTRPNASGFFSGTKLHGSFGKGIKEPSVYQQANSLYGTLATLSNGPSLLSQYDVAPLGPENSRTFDGGLDQQLLNGRARIGVTYFHNEFTNGVQYVPQGGLLELGVPEANLPAFTYGGAYLNASAFRSQGVEIETEYKLGSHLFARGGYTYTDAVVQHSFSSDNLGPSFNTASNFSTIPIGAYSPLDGARPFRVAPHTGYFGLSYTRSKFFGSLTGTLVGKRDDSDFLSDSNFGNSLLLPNHNLLGSYQRIEIGGGYQLTPRLNVYTNVQNLLSEHYFEAFGYPSLPLTFRSGLKLNFGGESWSLR
jgi:vitamin B12 transporter